MKNKTNQFNLICIILVAATAISWFLYFKQAVEKDTVNVHLFPKTIGPWTSEEMPITKDEFAILETNNAFVRKYTNALTKSQIYLFIIYSQTNRKVAHPPEICYTGSGMTIVEDVHDPIPVKYKNLTIQANRLHLVKKDFTHISYYWFKVADQFTSNYWKQQMLIAIYTLLGKHPSSALVRVSSDVKGNDMDATIKEIKSFSNLIAKDLFSYLP